MDRYADNSRVKIHYQPAGECALVVMIHGFPDYWATWKPQMGTLAAEGYRAAALDCRGYNLSDKPEGVEAYAILHLTGDIAAAVLDSLLRAYETGGDLVCRVLFEIIIESMNC